jgi:hypothetical protein
MTANLERGQKAWLQGSIDAGTGATGSVNQVAQLTARLLGRMGEWMAWARRIMFESGGNWSAVNRWDSNWLAGHPSVGGAQVIRGTFQAFADRFRNVGPFLYGVSINPLANSFAGANYAVHRYGSLLAVDPRVRPRGYDRGGMLPPGLSLAYNGTGRAEPVGGGGLTVIFQGPNYGGKAALDAMANDFLIALRHKQRNFGNGYLFEHPVAPGHRHGAARQSKP